MATNKYNFYRNKMGLSIFKLLKNNDPEHIVQQMDL